MSIFPDSVILTSIAELKSMYCDADVYSAYISAKLKLFQADQLRREHADSVAVGILAELETAQALRDRVARQRQGGYFNDVADPAEFHAIASSLLTEMQVILAEDDERGPSERAEARSRSGQRLSAIQGHLNRQSPCMGLPFPKLTVSQCPGMEQIRPIRLEK